MKKILICTSFVMVILGMQIGRRNDSTQPVGMISNIQTQLEAHIANYEMPPAEPRHDPIWQFVPGLEGIAFDFELSYQNMLTQGRFDPSLMVARRLPYELESESFRQYPIYRGHESSPYVALLINVAWGGEELVQMLDILETYDVRASLFFEGKFAQNNPELIRDAFDRGHIIGNHSYSHPANWLSLSYNGFKEEIGRTNDILTEIIGEEIIYFAPPGGAFNDTTVKAAYDAAMYTILWSADTIDWRGEEAGVLIDRVMGRITPGGLILTHPKPETVIALPTIIENLRAEGYKFRPIDEIVSGARSGYFIN